MLSQLCLTILHLPSSRVERVTMEQTPLLKDQVKLKYFIQLRISFPTVLSKVRPMIMNQQLSMHTSSLVPRPLPAICEIKSGSGLGTRLAY